MNCSALPRAQVRLGAQALRPAAPRAAARAQASCVRAPARAGAVAALAVRPARLGAAAPSLCAGAPARLRRSPGVRVAASAAAASPAPEAAAPLTAEEVSGLAAALATVRALGFYCVTVALSLPLFVSMVLITPFEFAFDKYRRAALHFVNDLWAVCSTLLFYRVEVHGAENLPKYNQPAVYVANHQSYLDIYSLFHLRRPFKFISKTSNFLIPIIGWSMYLTGHVPLKRMDRRSQMECLNKCRELLRQSTPVLFFPEGTRSASGKMAEFKKGAFTVAAKEGAAVVPITLDGTGRLMRNGREGQLFPGKVIITVHPQIPAGDADAMCAAAQAAVESALEAKYHAPKSGPGAAAKE